MSESFDFDGCLVSFEPGQTIGSALLAAGVRSWRRTRHGCRPRGIFCGIGVCFDCLVTVDGTPNQRACLVAATTGMRVRSQDGVGRADLAV